ncbi:unnamed protein product [Paramecium pentaurelia]|uniref:Uncharacterized protein n=1 Tax=Paramecium pentaurelia TaxID=43138 RepID=A0A8S1VG58_9CILI|nr:unnamed protein product [Paramecium pentaurelia]
MTLVGDLFYYIDGQILQMEFQYCHNSDIQYFISMEILYIKICHNSCLSCFGPSETYCITCPDEESNKTIAVDVEPLTQRMKILNVLKAYNTFQILLFWKVKILIHLPVVQVSFISSLGKQYIVMIVQAIRSQILLIKGNYYVLNQQKTWYSNPICTEDYEQLIQSSTSAYQKQARKPIDYEYFLINFNSNMDKIEIEICSGCLGETRANSDYIVRLNFEKEIKVQCETCYQIINGECINIYSNCDSCDSDQCISCSQGYTLYQNYCYNVSLYVFRIVYIMDRNQVVQNVKQVVTQILQIMNDCNEGLIVLYFNQEYQQMEISFKCSVLNVLITKNFLLTLIIFIANQKLCLIAFINIINSIIVLLIRMIYIHNKVNHIRMSDLIITCSWDYNFSKPSSYYQTRCALCEKGYLYNFYEYDWGKDKCILESEFTDLEIPKFNSLQIAPEPGALGDQTATVDEKVDNDTIVQFRQKGKKKIRCNTLIRERFIIRMLQKKSQIKYIKNNGWFNEYCILYNQGIMLNFNQVNVTYLRRSYITEHMDGNGKSGHITVQELAQNNDLAIFILSVPQLMQMSMKYFLDRVKKDMIMKNAFQNAVVPNVLYKMIHMFVQNVPHLQYIPINLINNQCTDCHAKCVLCRELNYDENRQINPYFNSEYSQIAIYSKSCIKGYELNKTLMKFQYIYPYPILNTQILCIHSQNYNLQYIAVQIHLITTWIFN